jgi:hypothetical protein
MKKGKNKPPHSPTLLQAPVQIVGATGKTVCEIRERNGMGVVVVFNREGQPAVEVSAMEEDGTGSISINAADVKVRISLEVFATGGCIAISASRHSGVDCNPGLLLAACEGEGSIYLAQRGSPPLAIRPE